MNKKFDQLNSRFKSCFSYIS